MVKFFPPKLFSGKKEKLIKAIFIILLKKSHLKITLF